MRDNAGQFEDDFDGDSSSFSGDKCAASSLQLTFLLLARDSLKYYSVISSVISLL